MRSVLAVVVGFAAMAVTVIVATVVLAEILYPDDARGAGAATSTWLVVNVLYSLAAAALGGWIAARLAPRAPFAHAVALAAVALALAIPGIAGGGQPGQPVWYAAALAAVAVAGILVGGALRIRQRGAKVATRPGA